MARSIHYLLDYNQCSGSGWSFLAPWIRILPSPSKKILLLLYDLWRMMQMYLQKGSIKNNFRWLLEGHWRKSRIQSRSVTKDTDPRIRIRAKMSRIPVPKCHGSGTDTTRHTTVQNTGKSDIIIYISTSQGYMRPLIQLGSGPDPGRPKKNWRNY